MYERMLNKRETPTFDDLIRYSGKSGKLWMALDAYLKDEFGAATQIRFPYGNKYGWSVKYGAGKKHVCDVFAENGAFAAFFRISADAIESMCGTLDAYAKNVWENRYPCGDGGWIDFRVLNGRHLQGLKKMIRAKFQEIAKRGKDSP